MLSESQRRLVAQVLDYMVRPLSRTCAYRLDAPPKLGFRVKVNDIWYLQPWEPDIQL